MKPEKTESLSTVEIQCAADELCDRFEAAWRSGPRPELAAWLPADGLLRSVALIELVLLDFDYRRRAGENANVDDYLARYPELGASEGALVSWPASPIRNAAPTSCAKR